jgi:hypothetical protein
VSRHPAQDREQTNCLYDVHKQAMVHLVRVTAGC